MSEIETAVKPIPETPVEARQIFDRLTRKIRLAHRWRGINERFAHPDLCLIGQYHGYNLGDIGLGTSVQEQAHAAGLKTRMQTLTSLDKWRPFPGVPAVVGGGVVLHERPLTFLINRFGESPEKLALIGVDAHEPAVLDQYGDFLKKVPVLTFRSERAAAQAREKLDRPDIRSHWDLAFGIPESILPYGEKKAGGYVLGFNVLPLYVHFVDHANFVYSHPADSPAFGKFARELDIYLEIVRTGLKSYLDRGFKLKHVPFTTDDDIFARTFFADLPIEFTQYTNSISAAAVSLRKCDVFLSSRFHSLIFALKAGVPCVPVSYAWKNLNFLHDLGADRFDPLFPESWLENPEAAYECVATVEPLKLPREQVESMGAEVREVIGGAIKKVTGRA